MSSYNDPAKQRSREKLLDFIRKHLSFRKPRDFRVVCFPGAEVEGEEALEVKEVYDKLGIPRQNIVGLEYDRENAERLRKANLGIQVVEIDAHSFFKTTTKQFDIICLDYCGQQKDKELSTLLDIARRKVLRNNAVISTVYSAKRESSNTQKLLSRSWSPDLVEMVNKHVTYEQFQAFREKREAIAESEIESRVFDLKKARDGIFMNSWRALTIHAGSLPKTFCYSQLHELLQEAVASQFYSIDAGFMSRLASMLASLLLIRRDDEYKARKFGRYSYTSNKNYLMLMDLFFIQYPSRLLVSIDDLVRVNESGALVINGGEYNPAAFVRQVYKIFNEITSLNWFFHPCEAIPERVDLGSSYDRSKHRRRISRKDALYLLREGVPAEEIVETYGGYTIRQLAAMKAHITMGTYEKQKKQM